MLQETKPNLVTITVDGEDFDVPSGMNLVDAIHRIGKEVPHYCYHSKLSVAGNCRMCLVEMGTPMRDRATGELVMEGDKPKIGWMPKPGIACATKVSPGLHVKLNSPAVKNCREGVTEFILLNHPLDCPICDQAGECKLQEYSAEYGRGASRYIDEKNVKPKKTRLGPRVTLDDERCILCSRCIRFCNEVAKDPVLGFINRGSFNTLTCYPGRELENNYSLNTVDICPVGALTSTDFRFKMRVWFLKQTPSICTESSVGVNTVVWSREGKIYRITPRQNDAVNDTWMADSGRMLYKQVAEENRLTGYLRQGSKVSDTDALDAAVALLKDGSTAYVASGHLSVEEQFLLRELIKTAPGKVYLPRHLGENDGLLISEDRTPNSRGALVTGLRDTLPDADLAALAEEIERGAVKTLVVCREDITQLGVSAELLKKAKVKVIYLGTHADTTAELAAVVLPGLTVFEKSGSFVNEQFRLQKFQQAVPGPVGVLPDGVILHQLACALGGEKEVPVTAEAIWTRLAKEIPVFAGLSFATIPANGRLLDAPARTQLAFPETQSLHYAPAANA